MKTKMIGYAICLNEWLFNNEIRSELRLLIYLSSLCAHKGVSNVSDDDLSKLFKVSKSSIAGKLDNLVVRGYIEVKRTNNIRTIAIQSTIRKVEHSEPPKPVWNDLEKKQLPQYGRPYYIAVDRFIKKQCRFHQVRGRVLKDGLNYGIEQYKSYDKLIKYGLSCEDIDNMLIRIGEDDFWSSNIMTVSKLLKKNKEGNQYWVVIKDKMIPTTPIKKSIKRNTGNIDDFVENMKNSFTTEK